MAINELIAQGVKPIGEDLPQVANMLYQRRQQDMANALAVRQEARQQQMSDLQMQNMQAEMAGRQQQQKREALTQLGQLARRALAIPPAQRKAFMAQITAAYPDLFMAVGVDPAQATNQLSGADDAKIEQSLQQLSMFAAPNYQTLAPGASLVDMNNPQAGPVVQGAREIQWEDLGNVKRAVDKRTGQLIPDIPALVKGRSPGESSKQEIIARPIENGMMQDFAFNPANPAARTPVGQPYRKESPSSPKDINTAKQKLVQLDLARKQLQGIRQAFDASKGISQGGFGQGWLPTVSGSKFDAAVAAIRPIFSGLTRVPGIGAMSDYETRLQQAPLPSRTDYEEVTQQKIQQIDDLITALERGYGDFLGGGEMPVQSGGTNGINIGQSMTINDVKVTRTR